MDPRDSHRTVCSTLFGLYEFDPIPFGLKNSPAAFQRLMDLFLTGLQSTELFVCLDDIVIHADILEEYSKKFTELINSLHNVNLKLQPDKCEFLGP